MKDVVQDELALHHSKTCRRGFVKVVDDVG